MILFLINNLMNHRNSWRFLILVCIWAISAGGGYAQTGNTEVQAFTLEECISYALQNAVNVKNATLDEEIAAARVKETVGIGLPQVSGSA